MSESNSVFIGLHDSPKLYRIGQVGYDTGSSDAGGTATLTGEWTTEIHHPAGRDGLVHFRRLVFRLLRITDRVGLSVNCYVDGQQTQLYNSSGDLESQDFASVTTGGGEREEIIEFDMNAVGTSIQVALSIDAGVTDPAGIVMLEAIEAHGRIIRPSKSRGAITEVSV